MEKKIFSVYKHPINSKLKILITECDLVKVYTVIRSTYYKQVTETVRKIKKSTSQQNYKARWFDYACFSGTFSDRCDKGLKEHSGLIAIDIDKIDEEKLQYLKKKLVNDTYLDVQLMYRSPRNGLKVIVPIDAHNAKDHVLWNLALERYFMNVYQTEIDKHCKNVCCASYLCYDPDAYINPNLLTKEDK